MKRDVLPQSDGGAPSAGADTVTRILRASRARRKGSTMEQLFAARRRVQETGGVPGLCGAVLHVAGWYVLWQEGPDEAVEEALRASQRKRRPDVPRVLHRSSGPRMLREPLAVSTTQWPETPELFERRIDAAAAAGLQPQEAWRLLSEPSTLAAPGEPPPPGRVGLFASADTRAVELARRLVDHFRRPLVYRRFAGADPASTDVGTAYFDIVAGGRPLRVHAVTRRAFGHPLVHASLGHPDQLALLPGVAPRTALELAAGVAAFLQGSGSQPSIDLVGGPDTAGPVAELLEQRAGTNVQVHGPELTDSQLLALLLGLGSARGS